ncbi:MAG: bifunctional nuclease family protein [Fimbriimonadaceae bacterium]|nr:bifunctional nuclease family protein [Fimbriimonadaceae bacterium]
MAGAGEYVQVEVVGVGKDPMERSIVVLRDAQERDLRIVIGPCEAIAIAQRLDSAFESPRPLPPDLAVGLWKRLGARLAQLRIDDMWQDIYYSKLTLLRGEEAVEIDCRPSDGIALALTAQVPIYVSDKVMDHD